MERQHEAAISVFLARYGSGDEFPAILLAGSLAHGYARPDSDVDIVLIATEDEYRSRRNEGKLAFSLWDICDYEGGYVDCKVSSVSALEEIAARGSDAARYAFKDARLLRSGIDGLPALLARVSAFPEVEREGRRHRFACQLLAWKWYLSQGEAKRNKYLIFLAAQKIVLFACRLILNENVMLYPYHKWLLEETGRAPKRPEAFLSDIGLFLEAPGFALAQRIVDGVFAFLGLEEKSVDWPNSFMADSEMNWIAHEAPIDDL